MEWEVKFKSMTLPPLTSNRVKILDGNMAVKTLQNPRNMSKFFPSGLCTMHLEWYPMKVTLRNMKRLAKANNVVVTMTTGDQGPRNEPLAISVGQIILLPCGELYTIFFHGDKMVDFKDHVVYHLRLFEKVRNPELESFFQLNFSQNFEVDLVKSEVKYFFSRFLWSGGAVTNVTDLDKYLASKNYNQVTMSKL